MLKQRRMVAEKIAGAVFDAEAAIDMAIAKIAHLTGVMPSLRREAGASALVGQDAVERASQAIMALAEARRAIVETHRELSVAQARSDSARWRSAMQADRSRRRPWPCRRAAAGALGLSPPSSPACPDLACSALGTPRALCFADS